MGCFFQEAPILMVKFKVSCKIPINSMFLFVVYTAVLHHRFFFFFASLPSKAFTGCTDLPTPDGTNIGRPGCGSFVHQLIGFLSHEIAGWHTSPEVQSFGFSISN